MPVPSPPSVAAWPGVELGERLTGGARNPVYRARRDGKPLVVRVSGRPTPSLDWELDLLDFLRDQHLVVPQTLPTGDGRRHDNGVLVQGFIAGGPPSSRHDWSRIVSALAVVHEFTVGWPQRPGFASARALLTRGRGGDVDLDAMPQAAAELIRDSWLPVLQGPECVIHGDLGAGNVLLTEDYVALIDWDEARVDVPAFDFAHLPVDVDVPFDGDRGALVTAGVAWETATCWVVEPEYAARRLVELQDRRLNRRQQESAQHDCSGFTR